MIKSDLIPSVLNHFSTVPSIKIIKKIQTDRVGFSFSFRQS